MATTGDNYGNPRVRASSNVFADRLGGSNSKIPLILYPYMWEDSCFIFDDFIGDAINLDYWLLTADGTATTFAISTGVGGIIAGSTGATDEAAHSIKGPLNYFGDNNCGMEVRWRQDVVVNELFEVGFADATTTDHDPILNDIDTPTIQNAAVDVALVVKDYSQTLKTMAFVTDGNTANMNTTKTNLGTQDMTADTYMTARIGIAGDRAFCGLYGAGGNLLQTASHGAATASSIEGGNAVQPGFLIMCKESAAVAATIDYIACWEDRVARS